MNISYILKNLRFNKEFEVVWKNIKVSIDYKNKQNLWDPVERKQF